MIKLIDHTDRDTETYEVITYPSGDLVQNVTYDEWERMVWAAEMLPPGTSSRGWRAYVLRFAAWLTRTTD